MLQFHPSATPTLHHISANHTYEIFGLICNAMKRVEQLTIIFRTLKYAYHLKCFRNINKKVD